MNDKLQITPHEAAADMLSLSEEQSRLSEEATELEIEMNHYLMTHRPDHDSDKATEAAWKTTERGIRQIRVESRLKVIKGELSVIKNYLRHCENAARNVY